MIPQGRKEAIMKANFLILKPINQKSIKNNVKKIFLCYTKGLNHWFSRKTNRYKFDIKGIMTFYICFNFNASLILKSIKFA